MWPFKPNVEALTRKGDVRGLIKASRHGSGTVRLAATQALGTMGSREAADTLVHRLGDANESVREAADSALKQVDSSDLADALTAAVGALTEPEAAAAEARAWRCDRGRLGDGAVSLMAWLGGSRAAAFLAAAAGGAFPHVDADRAGTAFEAMTGLDGAGALVEALETDAETIGLEPNPADAQRLRLVARVCSRQAVLARTERTPEEGAALERDIVPRAVVVLQRLILRPHVTVPAVDALGRIGGPNAVEILGHMLTGKALAAFPNEAEVRGRVVAALVTARQDAPDDLRESVNRHLAAALRLTRPNERAARAAACEALADWTPDNAEDHAWLLVAGGMVQEAAELGAAAVDALAGAVGGDAFLDEQDQAIDALIGLGVDEALTAMRRLVEQPDVADALRDKLARALDQAEAQAHVRALRSADPAARRAAADWLAEHHLEPEPDTEDEAFLLAARGQWDRLVERGLVAVEALRLAAETDPLAAATALARLGSDTACHWLGPVVREAGPDQVAAIDALVELGTERAALALASALGKVPDVGPVRSALVAIGEPAVTALEPALSANDLGLNRLAAEIIRAIGHRPDGPGEAAVLAVAAGDWPSAVEAGEAAVEPLRRFLLTAARQHAAYEVLTDVAAALARVAPTDDLLATIDDEAQPIQIRLSLSAGLVRAGDARGVDRLMRWLFAAPRRLDEPPLPWLAALLDEVAERMELTGRVARAMVSAGAFALEPLTIGEDAIGVRADTTAGAEAVALLAESDVPAAVNVLNLVAEMADAEVAVPQPGYGEPVTLTVDFSARRGLARQRLRQLGKPPADPAAYLGAPT